MNDIKLYEQVLGDIRPWRVERVTMNREAMAIEVELSCPPEVWACPQCHTRAHIHGYERRRWRHLDTCQFKTILTAEVPRVSCKEHGTVQVQVPWAEQHGRFTALFERLAIDLMKECSTSAACEILRISWGEADRIKQRAVDRGLKRQRAVQRAFKRLCIDEKAVGWGHRYVTIVSSADGDKACVLAIEDDREECSLNRFWRTLTAKQRSGIETVAMDMWKAYRKSTLRHVPGAAQKIVYDNFHVAKHMNRAVDEVRRSEHVFLQGHGNAVLKGTRQLWLYGMENVPRKWASRFKALRDSLTQTAKAWKIKELLRSLWQCEDEADATAYFTQWCSEAMATGLEPVKRVVRLLKRHWDNIVTYFRYHLSNAAAEGLNSRVQHLIQRSCGYRNRDRFKRDVFFHLGGLDLYPVLAQ